MPTSDSGDRQARDQRRRQIAEKNKDHEDDERDGKAELELNIGDRRADRRGTVAQHVDRHGGGQSRLDLRQQRLDGVDDLDHVGARLTLDVEDDGRRLVCPGSDLVVLGTADRLGDCRQTHWVAIAVGDDDVFELVCVGDLIVGVDG